MGITLLTALNIIAFLNWSMEEWEEDAANILADGSWKCVAERRKRENADDYS